MAHMGFPRSRGAVLGSPEQGLKYSVSILGSPSLWRLPHLQNHRMNPSADRIAIALFHCLDLVRFCADLMTGSFSPGFRFRVPLIHESITNLQLATPSSAYEHPASAPSPKS